MINNDVMRSIRYMLDLGDARVVEIIHLADPSLEIDKDDIPALLKKEGEAGFTPCSDRVLAMRHGSIVAQMERGVDVIKASRFIEGGSMEGVPWRRTIFSRGGNLVARALFRVGLRDCTNGFRAVKVAILARMDLRESGFPIIVEELYKAKWLARTFCEVPVVLTGRGGNRRPTSFSYKPETFRKYLAFAIKAFFRVKPDLKQEIV